MISIFYFFGYVKINFLKLIVTIESMIITPDTKYLNQQLYLSIFLCLIVHI